MQSITRRRFMHGIRILPVAAIAGCATSQGTLRPGGRFWMYVGTYTGPSTRGIHLFRFDATTGDAHPEGLAAECANPSFLAVHPRGRHLYAVNETSEWHGRAGGYLTAFAIDRGSGRLSRLNEVSSTGDGPCHLSLDRTGRTILVANYGGGSFASIPVNEDGTMGAAATIVQHVGSSVNAQRQEAPHGHSILPTPDNRFAVAADLGLDKIRMCRLDPGAATLSGHLPAETKLAPGSGPRHMAFHPNGRFLHVINELLCTVTTFAYDAVHGTLREIQTVSTLPADVARKPEFSTAEIVVHPSGQTVYGSNRGHHSIAVFHCDPNRGRLTLIQNEPTQGATPRNFALDPTGRWLFAANQDSNTLVQFRVDRGSGRLSPTGRRWTAGTPVCIRFAPA